MTVDRRALEAMGHVVVPGFIDVHTHADDIADNPRHLSPSALQHT